MTVLNTLDATLTNSAAADALSLGDNTPVLALETGALFALETGVLLGSEQFVTLAPQ